MNHKISKAICCLLFVSAMLPSASAMAIELVSKHGAIFEQALNQQVLLAGVELILLTKGEERVIPPTYELKSGDRIRLRLRTSIDSEYRLYVLDKKGKKVKSLFLKGKTSSAVTTLVPSPEHGVLELDSKPGVEWLQLVITGINGSKGDSVEKSLLKQKHPHGKIEQIILRNIELLSPPAQKVQYDPLTQIIYFSQQKPGRGAVKISLKLGLNHR